MGGTNSGIIRCYIYFFLYDVNLKLFEWDSLKSIQQNLDFCLTYLMKMKLV